jgi:hypothetical protein
MSFPTTAQIDNLLMKKNQLVPFTSTTLASNQEATGSSAVKSISSNVWAQKIPNASPFSILDLVSGQAVGLQTKSDGSALIPGGGGYTVTKSLLATGGYKYVNNDPASSFVVYYEKVVLASTIPNVAFRYAGTDTAIGVLETNILISGIPAGYDPANGTYKVQVYNSAASNTAMSGTVSDYPWIYDGTSGYLTFFQSLLNYPGGRAIPVISFWRYEGATLQDKLIAIDASMATAGSGGTGSDPSFQQWIVDPPKPIVFPTPNALNTPTSQKIYIPWDYPQQFSIGLVQTMVPNITSLSVQWTAKLSALPFYKSSQAIITGDKTCVRYGSTGLSGTDGLTTAAVTGLILTNVSQSTTYASVVWPDGITRWSCTFYSADFANLTCAIPGVADPSNVITAWYNNYNPNSGVTNKNTQSFKIFLVAGPPSPPGVPSFTPTASQTASTTAAGTGISGTMTQGSVGTYTDSTNSNNTPTISNWKYTGTGIASATRWIGGTYTTLTPAAITSGEIATGTTSSLGSLYPDTTYSFYNFLKNNANANYSQTSAVLSVTTTNIAPIRVMPTAIALSTTPTATSAKLVAANGDSIAKDTPLSVWFGTLSTISTAPFYAPIHYKDSRGTLTANSTRLLDITSNVTRSGMTTQTGGTCKYTSFPTASASGGAITNGITITSASSVDSFTTTYLAGYYLETGANSVTITGTTIWTASPNKTNINVSLQRYQSDGITTYGLASVLTPAYFYYDPYSTSPSISSFSASLTSMATPIKISGVEIITGNIGLTGTTNVLNIGNYFYVNGAIITYSTGQTEAGLGNMTTDIVAGGTLAASCTFTNASLSVAAPTTYAAVASISVNASSVKNCVGTSIATGTTAVSFNMLFDPLSITLIGTGASKYPASFPNTNGVAGIRVYSGQSNASGSTALQTRFIPTFPNAIILTAYVNSVVINDTANNPNYSEDLQLCNGLIRTKGTTTQGYVDYTANKISISANSTLNYNDINNTDNAGYRYATFAWLCPVTAGTYSKITFTMYGVSSTITGVTTEQPQVDGANIYMFYRLQEGGTTNTGSVSKPGNANTYWINAFGSSTLATDGNVYDNSNPSALGGDNQALPSTFVGTTLTMYCIIPSFVVSNDILGNANSRIMYFRVGLPMAKDIGFEYITASFS